MSRVFASLAVAQLILMFGAGATGLLDEHVPGDRHVLLAAMAILLGCLNQAALFTYVTVTGKMIAQAVHLGKLANDAVAESRQLKRAASRHVALIMLSVLFPVATGAARLRSGEGSAYHFAAAGFVAAVHLLIYFREYDLVIRNAFLFDRTLLAYRLTRKPAPAFPSAGGN